MSSFLAAGPARDFIFRRRVCLGAALALASRGGFARVDRDVLPLVLATEAPPDLEPQGWLVSEKLDGARAWWDGSRLRFRSGLPIVAPAWFTAGLPPQALDGELWAGRGTFEFLAGTVRRRQPVDDDWRRVRFMVFESPSLPGTFAERVASIGRLARQQPAGSVWQAVEHTEMPSRAALLNRLDAVVRAGGEGLMLRRANAAVEAGRSVHLLKLKPLKLLTPLWPLWLKPLKNFLSLKPQLPPTPQLPLPPVDPTSQLVQFAVARQPEVGQQVVAVALQLPFGLLLQLRVLAPQRLEYVLHQRRGVGGVEPAAAHPLLTHISQPIGHEGGGAQAAQQQHLQQIALFHGDAVLQQSEGIVLPRRVREDS